MKDVIELAKQAGFQKFLKPENRPEMICDPAALERFAALVGNAKLEEAAKRFDDLNLYGTKTADTKGVAVILRNLKEPTP